MKSIRQRLFVNFIGISLLLLVTIWLCNSLFLTKYYVKREEQTLLNSYNTLNNIEADAYPMSLDTFITIETKANIDIILYDDNNTIVYTSNNYLTNDALFKQIDDRLGTPPRPGQDRKLPGKIAQRQNPVPFKNANTTLIDDQTRLVSGYDPIIGAQSLSLIGALDNGYYVNLRLPLASIESSVRIINTFLLMTGAGIIVIALIISLFLSSYFTKPIRQINAATKRLKSLDFSEPCMVTTEDELGQLAYNVNDMSHALSNALNSLNRSNQQLTDEIKQKNLLDEKRRQLLNNVSHELKTPLALMEGYAEALQLGIATDPSKTEFYCNVIMDETEKMNQLVQSLLNIDQIEFGDISSHPIKMDLIPYIKGSIDKYNLQITDNNLNTNLVCPDSVMIHIDPLELEQLFVNYLTNAIHYADTYINITIEPSEQKDFVKVTVANDCPSISQHDLDKVWDSFYKIDVSRSRSVGGHGLGLSIVKAIQTKHGFDYGARSTSDGVQFWFDCPIVIA